MAPIIPKRSLKCSTPDGSLPYPKTSEQWKLVLQDVKSLYLRRQYKQCAARAAQLLNNANPLHPVYKTFLHFYSAISYEALGRAAHIYSSNKVPLFRLALDHFTACNASLPPVTPVPCIEDDFEPPVENSGLSSSPNSEPPEQLSPVDSVADCVARIFNASNESSVVPDDDPFISKDPAPIKENMTLIFRLPDDKIEESSLMPPPLHIRKCRKEPDHGCEIKSDLQSTKTAPLPCPPARARPLPPLPIKIVPARNVTGSSDESDISKCNSANTRSISNTSASSISSQDSKEDKNTIVITPVRAKAVSRYNNHIRSFSSHVRANIAVVSSLIATTTELQHIHRATRDRRSASFWSFTPLEAKSNGGSMASIVSSRSVSSPATFEETKQERIARLRAEGWNTVGLRAKHRGWKGKEYYERLCSEVLDDLYLDEY